MQVFFSDEQLRHQPLQYMRAGRIVAPVEVPERAQRLAKALAARGLACRDPGDHGLTPVTAVHADHFVAFLRSAHAEFRALPEAGPEVLPNIHPHVSAASDLGVRRPPRPVHIVGRAGWYLGDMSCAIGPGTWAAAYASAQASIAAARAVLDGAAESLALCRPPGHHAYADRASGFCFLNNAAIAAALLRTRYGRVAVLDFDTHHGDGTQAIFYGRSDVFYGSVHTDPAGYYPYFAGYADERGVGEGAGFNRNIALPPGATDDAFVAANQELIAEALSAGAEALVLSAGWDAHRDDPLSKLAVTTEAFRRLGRLYGALRLPVVIVQEGGYSLSAIEAAAPLFATEFLGARRA